MIDVQVAHHLATVADAEREGVLACEKRLELRARAVVKQHALRPALAGAEDVAITETAACRRGRGNLRSETRPLRMSVMWTSIALKPARVKAAAISTSPLTPCSRASRLGPVESGAISRGGFAEVGAPTGLDFSRTAFPTVAEIERDLRRDAGIRCDRVSAGIQILHTRDCRAARRSGG